MKHRVSVHLRWRPCIADGEGAGIAQPWSTEVFATLGAALDRVREETVPTIWRTTGPGGIVRTTGPGAVGRVWTQVGGVPREVVRIAAPPPPRTASPWQDPMRGLDWVHAWESGVAVKWMIQAVSQSEELRWRAAYALAATIIEATDDGSDGRADVRLAAAAMRRAVRRPDTYDQELDAIVTALPGGPRDVARVPIGQAHRARLAEGLGALWSLHHTARDVDATDQRWADVVRSAITVDSVFLFHAGRLRERTNPPAPSY